MKILLLCIMVGLIKLAFSTVSIYWFPVTHEERPAWATSKERVMERAGAAQERA